MSKNYRSLVIISLVSFGLGLIVADTLQLNGVSEFLGSSTTPAYLVADITVHDAERYRDYLASVPNLIEEYGGEFLVRGGNPLVLEGDWSPSRFIIMEFPDRETILTYQNDPEYLQYKSIRQAVTDSNLIVVDGS